MVRKLLAALFVLGTFVPHHLQAQGTNEPTMADFTKASDILPPSPNAASLGKYGGVQIGLATGAMSHSIPLHTLKSVSLELPISLGYSSNGLRVDEIASRAGTGWNLNAGGVVTRTVFGAPDENVDRVSAPEGYNRALIDFMEQVSTSNELGPVDAQPDMFAFNFGSYSGKFVLDDAMNPVQLSHSSLKIEPNLGGQESSFVITAPDGVKYFFGGAGATETSKKSTSGTGCGRDYTRYVPTAWYISHIVHPSGDTLAFHYSAVSLTYTTGVSQTMFSSTPVKDGPCSPVGSCEPLSSPICRSVISTEGVLLDSITSTQGAKVAIGYRGRLDLQGDKLVAEVRVLRGNGATYKTFALSYTEASATFNKSAFSVGDALYRPFLAAVSESSADNKHSRTHRFEYSGLNRLPARLSYAQDHFGFYNGKSNNTLIPMPVEEDLKLAFPQASANREPDAAFAKNGLLSKIVYPTGGADSIIYEGNSTYGLVTVYPDPVAKPLGGGGIGLKYPKTYTSTITLPYGQTVKVAASFRFDEWAGDGPFGDGETPYKLDELHHQVTVQIYQLLPNGSRKQVVLERLNDTRPLVEIAPYFSQGNYEINMTADGEPSIGGVIVTYRDRNPYQEYRATPLGGVRVAEVITTDPIKAKSMTKQYLYAPLASPQQQSGEVGYEPRYDGELVLFKSCGQYMDPNHSWNNCDLLSCRYVTLHTNSQSNIYATSGAPVYYRTVVELNEDGGGVEHRFHTARDAAGNIMVGSHIMGMPYTFLGWNNGKEYYSKVFKREDGRVLDVQETFTHYREDPRVNTRITAYVARKKYTYACVTEPPRQEEFEAYDLMSYYHQANWVYVDTVRTRTYAGNGIDFVENITITEYGNLAHAQPTRIKTLTSSREERVVELLYPQDITLSDSAEIARQRLISDHMLAMPLEQRVSQAGKQTLRVRTDYAMFPNGQALPKSQHVQSGNAPMEKRVEFSAYNAKGRLTEQARTDDVKTSYLWGYGYAFPIAEIKNASYTQVKAALGGDAAVEAIAKNPTLSQSQLDLINALRAQLPNAVVTTYTYDPLAGLLSSTDPNGRTTYYTYDTLGRLQTVKDHDENVLKSYEYNYRK